MSRVEWLSYAVAAVGAYLLGSIPTGYLVARAKGLDIRTVGSGNIGATNVFRFLGRPAGVLVLVVDALKGFLACGLIANVAQALTAGEDGAAIVSREPLSVVAGVCAVLGHNFTFWLGFKGGKGIATSAGVLIALVPWALLIIFGVWLIVFVLGRYVSLASIAASFALPFAVWLTHGSFTMIAITGGLSALAIYKHRANIQRLLKGTEARISLRPRPTAP